MSFSIIVSRQQLRRIKSLFFNRYLSLPTEFLNSEEVITLKDLLTQIVVDETNAFGTRQKDGKLTHILTKVDIEKGSGQGKIDIGGRDVIQEVASEALVKNALRAFEDGLYFIFINDVRYESKGRIINLEPNGQRCFLRLVPLVGG